MEFEKVLKLRRSARKYRPEQITDAQLEKLLFAGSSAPVGKALYENYRMTVIQDKELIAKISRETGPRMFFKADNPAYDVPTLIIVSGRQPEDDSYMPIMCANAACIVEHMHLMATNEGLGSVYLWGFIVTLREMPELMRQAGIPEGFVPLSALGAGYADEPQERNIKPDRIITNYIK